MSAKSGVTGVQDWSVKTIFEAMKVRAAIVVSSVGRNL